MNPSISLRKSEQISIRAAHGRAGLSLIENVVAMGIVAVFFSGLFSLSSHCMTITNTGRQAALASMAFSERTATLRDCTWTQLTSSSYLQTSVLNNATASASQLGSLTETITVNSYPTALNPAISVVRNSNGTVTVATTNSAIASGSMARVDISLNWTGSNGRSRTEGTTTVIARVDP